MKAVSIVFHFFQSFFYFYIHSIFNKKIDVLFYYPTHFNLSNNEVRSIQVMIDVCKEKKISFFLLEEPNYNSESMRNLNAIKFDFFYLIISILRKFITSTSCVYQKDRIIGRLLSFMFVGRQNIKNIITLSQSMQSFFSVVYPNSNLFDYQHGLISNIYDGYAENNKIAATILQNNVKLLLHGKEVKEKLIAIDGGEYFIENSIVVGAPYLKLKKKSSLFNGNILFSLQFSNSHTFDQNQLLLEKTIFFLNQIELKNINVKIYLKHHPRFNNCLDIKQLYDYKFVYDSPIHIKDCFDLCTLHITEYSTMVLESIIFGTPSLFTSFNQKFDLFNKEYGFPYSDLNIIDGISKLYDDNFYIGVLNKQSEKTQQLYQPFDKDVFIKTILQ